MLNHVNTYVRMSDLAVDTCDWRQNSEFAKKYINSQRENQKWLDK